MDLARELRAFDIGGVSVMVEAVSEPGVQPTARGDDAGRKLENAFERARDVIERLATSVSDLRTRIATEGRAPDQVELQFGLSFSAEGNIILASSTVGANLSVRITYADPAGPGAG